MALESEAIVIEIIYQNRFPRRKPVLFCQANTLDKTEQVFYIILVY